MKQFLRHIFLLLVLFVATASAWAECYVLEKYTTDSEKYITVESNRDGSSFSESFPVSNGYELTFSYCLSGSSSVSYNHYVAPQYSTDDGANFTDILPEGTISTKSRSWRHTKDDDKLTFILPSGTTHIRFRRRASSWFGTRDLYIKNVRVTRISSISVSAPATFPFDPIPVGTTATKTVKINYSNIGTSVYASACDPADVATHFALTSAENLDCAGTVELTLTYQPQTEGTHGGTATISGSNGTSCTINVSGSAFAVVDPTHTWNAPTTYKVGDPNLDLASIWTSNSSGSIIYRIKENSFKPSGTNNEGATSPSINGNVLTLGQAGTLVIEMVQDATTGFYAKTSEQTITINKYNVEASISQSTAVWNEIIDNPFSLSYGLINFDVESKNTNIAEYHKDTKKIQTYFTDGIASFQVARLEDYKYNALSKTLTLDVNKSIVNCPVLEDSDQRNWETIDNSGTYTIPSGTPDSLFFQARRTDILGFTNTTEFYAEYSSDNNTWTEAMTINLPDQGTWYDLKCDIPETAKYVRFITYTGATGNKHIRNVCVTRKNYLRPSMSSLALPQTTIGKTVSASFDLNWSTCSDEIVLLSTNRNFVLSKSSIDATSGRGTTTITVTYDANSGSQSGTIFIYDQSQKIEIPVSCEVKAKLTTEIIYTGKATYPDTPEGIPYPFYVKDENGNTVQGAAITLATSNEDILSFDDTKIYPHCGGSVTLTATYAGDDTHESCSLSVALTVPYCQREIVWNTSYLDFAVDANGFIDKKRVLDATINPESEITYQLHAVTSTPFAEIVEEGDKYFVRVFGEGHGYIVAIANECLYEGQRYDATYKIKELRVSGAGVCDPNSLLIWGDGDTEPFVYKYSTNSSERTRIYHLTGLPADKMTFGAHAATASLNNILVISFSTESEGNNWIGVHRQEVVSGSSYNWNYSCPVPEGAKRVRFQSEASLTIYFNGVTIPQQTYIRPSVESIEISDAIVNEPFAPITFSVDYSNVRLLQWKVSNNNDLGLKVVANQEVNNDCNMHGTYTFTLTGESPYPQKNVTETITFYTSAGDEVKIPVTITATLSDTYYFNQQAGNWGDLNNWQLKEGATPTKLPTASNPVVITKPMTINEGELVAYSVAIENGGSVNIQPKGGLTLHAGGFAEGVTNDNFTIENNQDGVGYVRVSPYFINKVPGTMPNITVQYTTRAKAGGAKDQVWQYVGAPGKNMQMSNDGVMVYLWSETDGWVYSNTNMTPFEGYALTRTAEGTETYSIVAQPIHDNQTINLTKTANGMNGDNLFVNSYLAPIDLTKFTDIDDALNDPNDDFRGDFEKTFYLFNSGSWNDWQGENGEGANNILKGESAGKYYPITPLGSALIDPNKDQTTIPPMQGVYVVANGEAQIHLKYNKHVFRNTSADMNRPMRAPQIEDENFMRVRMQVNSQNSGADRMYVIQYENTTRGYDNGYDAKNIIAQGQANIYTNEPEGQMEISIADQIDSTFIGFAAGEDSEYTLTFTSLVGQDMYLHDLESDSLFLITEEGQYTFSAHPNSVNDMRFQLLLYPDFSDDLPGNGVTTGIDNLVSSAQVWVNDKRVYIADAPQNSKLVVYTANGMCITSPLTIHHTPCTIDLSHLPTGVYVLRLNNQAYKFVCK